MTQLIVWLTELSKSDTAMAGGKGANLGELCRAGLPVPPGFVITVAGYLEAMDEGGVRDELHDLFVDASRLADDHVGLAERAERLRSLVRKAGLPTSLRDDVLSAYRRLGPNVPVAVRPSATSEDATGTSFAGMHESYTNVVGSNALVERIVDCWVSLYDDRVISYRVNQSLTNEPAIAVVVQRLVDADRAGVLFTSDPSTGDTSRIVVEGAFGFGEAVVNRQVEPDTYVLTKDGPRLLHVRVGKKTHKLVPDALGAMVRVELDEATSIARALNDDETMKLARLGLRAEDHYGCPQNVEWALSNDGIYIVQSRPMLPKGLAASAGSATSTVRVPESADIGRFLPPAARTFGPGMRGEAARQPRRRESAMSDIRSFEVLSEPECRRLLAQQSVGRVAFTGAIGYPVVLPVNYVIDRDVIAFRTSPGEKFDSIPTRPVALQVDGIDRSTRTGWSVLAQGVGRDITGAAGVRYERLRQSTLSAWAPGEKSLWLAIDVRQLSGRRVSSIGQPTDNGCQAYDWQTDFPACIDSPADCS